MAQMFCFHNISMVLHLLLVWDIVRVFGANSKENRKDAKISKALQEQFNGNGNQGTLGVTNAAVLVDIDCFSKNGGVRSIHNTDDSIRTLVERMGAKAQDPKESKSPDMTAMAIELQERMTKELDPVVKMLDKFGVASEGLWSTGQVYVPQATWNMVQQIAGLDEVVQIRSPGSIPPPSPLPNIGAQIQENNIPWNLKQIDARCSEISCLGEGVTVGFLDSGVLATHVELRDNFVGMPYGFYDGFSPIANCTPRDTFFHGTWCAGIAVGATVGVAPKAKWMACIVGDESGYPYVAIIKCAQFMFCPWHCNDTSPTKVTKDCSKRPDVINNSWAAINELWDDFFYTILELFNAVGIVTIFSGGNSGPRCTSACFPAALDIALGVGATDINGTIPFFSSVGPALTRKPLTSNSTATGTCKKDYCSRNRSSETACVLIKPDMVAPGVLINGSIPPGDTDYGVFSGTSASAPAVTGVVALMMCANPHLRWNYKLAYKLLTTTVNTSKLKFKNVPDGRVGNFSVDTNLMCNAVLSKITCNRFPNNMFGHGLVNACAAVKAARKENTYGYDLYDKYY